MSGKNTQMPRYPASYWRETHLPAFERLSEDHRTDVAIVGGGLTGITAGYLLAKEGLRVAIVEAGKILSGTTGHTTAKITAQHGIIYDELINRLGQEQAHLYYKANEEALHFIKNTVREHKIDCDFSLQDAILYTNTEDGAGKLEKEAEAYEKLGISGTQTDRLPLNLETKSALIMHEQAQFHPLKYLKHLLKLFLEAGGKVFEHTVAVDIEYGSEPTLILRDGKKVACKYIVAASHFPFCDKKGLYFARMYVERAYLMAIKTKKPFPGGMYLSIDSPPRTLRSVPAPNGEQLVLVGGESHKTGQGINTFKHYLAIQDFAEKTLGIQALLYRWSAQDIYTLDKIPYVGPVTSGEPRVLIATGYKKWGMTSGTAAAHLLKDCILERENPYKELFSTSRFHADPGLKEVFSINADVAKHLIKGKLDIPLRVPEDVRTGEAAIVIAGNGERAGAYRDEEGVLHLVDTTCRHLGCEVEWNEGEKTWDCPCHGSRYSITGEVINGPASMPLDRIAEE